MNKKIKTIILALVIVGIVVAGVFFFANTNVAVLNPKGEVAQKQRDILIFSLLLISIVVVPVFVLLSIFAWRYREGKNATYRPNWDNNKVLEWIWWGVPFVIIIILAVVTWRTSHELDPYKTLQSNTKPLHVQVIALQWKWLFIYPEQRVASVNMLHVPEDTPINFTLTSDAPMNAFWIPSLGTQVYAMSGMSSKLSLNATEPGDYKGSSSNISGEHFADMSFVARAYTKVDFDKWVQAASKTKNILDQATYDELAKPDTVKESRDYILKKYDLYDSVVMKYMMPRAHDQTDQNMYNHMHMTHDMGGM